MKLLGIGLGMNAATLAIGAAAVMFGPALLAMAGSAAKPLLKAGIKGSLLLYDRGKRLALEAKESLEDIAAEAKESLEDIAAEAKEEIAETPKRKAAKKAA
jgi:hypothetical protein